MTIPCRVSLNHASSNYGPSLDGVVRVVVVDASTNDPLEDVNFNILEKTILLCVVRF